MVLPEKIEIDNNDEYSYNLTNLGLKDLYLVIEADSTYIDGNDFYLDFSWLPDDESQYPIDMTDDISGLEVKFTYEIYSELKKLTNTI